MRRTETTATMKCNRTGEQWQLTCKNGDWSGQRTNCSASGKFLLLVSYTMSHPEFDSFTYFSSGFLLISKGKVMFSLTCVWSRMEGVGYLWFQIPSWSLVPCPFQG